MKAIMRERERVAIGPFQSVSHHASVNHGGISVVLPSNQNNLWICLVFCAKAVFTILWKENKILVEKKRRNK